MSDLLTGDIPASPAASRKTTGVTKLNNRPLIAIVSFIVLLFMIAGYALKTMGDRQTKTVQEKDESYSAVKQNNFVDSYLGSRSDGLIEGEVVARPPAFLEVQPEVDSPIKTVSMKEAINAPLTPIPVKPIVAPPCGTPEECDAAAKMEEAIAQEKMRMELLKRKNLEDAANGSMRVNFSRTGDPELGLCGQSEDGCADGKGTDPGSAAGPTTPEQILARGNNNVGDMLNLLRSRVEAAASGNVVLPAGMQSTSAGVPSVSGSGFQPVAAGIPRGQVFPQQGGGVGTSTDSRTDFIQANKQPPDGSDYLEQELQDPRSETELKAGTVIRAAMLTGINSELPGQVIGQVTRNVWDTNSGEYILIPQGSRLIGVYDSAVAFGQKRVLVVWNRLIYPNGQSIRLEGMGGYDKAGQSGYKDKVNNHYGKIFGGALLFSIVAAGVSSVDDNTNDRNGLFDLESEFKKQLGQQISQLSNKYIGALLTISPTLTIRQGYVMNVMIDRDIVLPPYEQMHKQLTSRYVSEPK